MAVRDGLRLFLRFMGGETDQWEPYLFRDHTQIFPWIGKPGYNLTTDMADEAINYMNNLNAVARDKPFFVYYVPGGSHSPHQPTKEWIDKFKGKFDLTWAGTRCASRFSPIRKSSASFRPLRS
jgi:arylsulfatase A-like enzyme